jgi:hypothetical protein
MIKLISVQKRISSKVIVCIILIFFFIGYFLGINTFISTIFSIKSDTVGSDILSGTILALISGMFFLFKKLYSKGPIKFPIPKIVFITDYLTSLDTQRLFNIPEGCIPKNNGFLLKGFDKYSHTDIKLRETYTTFTIAADFKAYVSSKNKYWRYGISLTDQNNVQIAMFHLDSDDQIIVYFSMEKYIRYKSEIRFSNNVQRLKVFVSKENNSMNISFYLNEYFIVNRFYGKSEWNMHANICAWSDNDKNHRVRIQNIILKK